MQTTQQDIRDKGLLLPQRIHDFLTYADEIDFYYRDGVHQDAVLAATWLRNDDSTGFKGTLQITDAGPYQKIKDIHNAAVDILKKPDLYWESAVEAKSELKKATCSLSQALGKLSACISKLFSSCTKNSTYSEEAIQAYFKNFPALAKAEDWQQIIVQGEKALSAARATKNIQDEAKICAQLTSSYFYQGNYSKAQTCAQRCHVLSKEFTDPSLFVRTLYLESAVQRALAGKEKDVKEQQRLYHQAVEVAKQAAGIYHEKQLNDAGLKGKVFFNLGAAHADNPHGNLEEAARCYALAMESFQSSAEDLARTSIRLAKVHLLRKDYSAVQRTIDAVRHDQLPSRIAMHLEYLEAQLKLELGQFDAALKISSNGLARAKNLGAKEDELRFVELMQNLEYLCAVSKA